MKQARTLHIYILIYAQLRPPPANSPYLNQLDYELPGLEYPK